jgi:hypothetical protein
MRDRTSRVIREETKLAFQEWLKRAVAAGPPDSGDLRWAVKDIERPWCAHGCSELKAAPG